MGKFVPHVLTGSVSLLADTSDIINVQTAGNKYFIRGILAKSTGAFTLQITPSDSNKQLFSTAIDSTLITGLSVGTGASGPYRIDGGPGNERRPTPLIVEKSTTIIIEVLDTSGSGNTIVIALDGYRLEN